MFIGFVESRDSDNAGESDPGAKASMCDSTLGLKGFTEFRVHQKLRA